MKVNCEQEKIEWNDLVRRDSDTADVLQNNSEKIIRMYNIDDAYELLGRTAETATSADLCAGCPDAGKPSGYMQNCTVHSKKKALALKVNEQQTVADAINR
jgi:hypothetical protein